MLKKLLFYTFSLLLFAVSFYQIPTIKAQKTHKNFWGSLQDTVWVYDTVVVYDTVWVYDTVEVAKDVSLENKLVNNWADVKKLKPLTLIEVVSNVKEPHINLGLKKQAKETHVNVTSPSFEKKAYNKRQIRRARNYSFVSNYQYSKRNPSTINRWLNLTKLLNGYFSLRAYGGVVGHSTHYKYPQANSMYDTLTSKINSLIGIQNAIGINYRFSQMSLETGLGYVNCRERIKYKRNNVLINNITNAFVVANSSINHVQLEVPVALGYHWNNAMVDCSVHCGIVNQFHIYSKGKYFADLEGRVEDIKEVVEFSACNVSFYTRVGCSYNVLKRISIGLEGFYKHPLNKFSSALGMSVYKQLYGMNIAVQYRISKY